MRKPELLIALLLAFSPIVTFAAVIRVPVDQPTIQAGIDAAIDGDTVLVAAGTYRGEGNRDIDFYGKAVTLLSENGPVLTVIDCEGSAVEPHRGFLFENDEGPGSIIQGFTVCNGYANRGGAIHCDYYCSPTIIGNIIRENTAQYTGGGIHLYAESTSLISRNTISNNRTLYSQSGRNGGGGIHIDRSRPTFQDNIVTDNRSASYGGGILVNGTDYLGPLQLENNLIADNRAGAEGGGVFVSSFSEDLVLAKCTIVNNSALRQGGGFCVSWFVHRVYLDDCIVWGNTAPEGSQGFIRDLTVLNFCDIQGGRTGIVGADQLFWGEGNLNALPFFVRGPLGDYYLSQTAAGQLVDSPCLDSGNPDSTVPAGTTRTDNVQDAAPLDIGFHHAILSEPHLWTDHDSFTIYASLDSGAIQEAYLQIRNGGPGAMAWAVFTNAPWLILEPGSGSSSGEADRVRLEVDNAGMDHGSYEATIQVLAPGAEDAPLTIPVYLHVFTEASIAADGTGDFPAIKPALDQAVDGDTLVIQDGVYQGPLNRDLDFRGKRIRLESANGPEVTIIDCEKQSRGISFGSGEDVAAVLDGLTIRNGHADLGGGIFCGEGTSPTLVDLVIENCQASAEGGGIYCERGSSPTFSGRISGNTAGSRGGGCVADDFATITMRDSLVDNNIAAEFGGGLAALKWGSINLVDSRIISNRADSGGGIALGGYPGEGTHSTYGCIRGTTIRGNEAVDAGGGIYIYTAESDTTIEGNHIVDNSAENGGGISISNGSGGVCFRNNLIYSNTARDSGGAVYSNTPGMLWSSCTVCGNQALVRGGGIYFTQSYSNAYYFLENNIIRKNSAPAGADIFGHDLAENLVLRIDYCNLEPEGIGGSAVLDWGAGNLNADPLFVSGPLGPFYLSQFAAGQAEQSPCVDAGDPASELVDGTTRTDAAPDVGVIDMGFHYPPETSAGNVLIATGPGPAGDNPCRVRVFPAEQDAAFLSEFTAYGADRYGVLVASGEYDGDWGDEIITGAGPGAVFGAHVRAFEIDGTPLPGLSFLAYATRRFGVNVAAGDLTGNGTDEIITGAGPGSVFGPHVRAFDYDGATVAPIPGVSYFAYPVPQWGVNVACGDLDGDGFDEIVTGPGPGAVYGPHVRGWNIDGGTAVPLPGVSFLAYNTRSMGVVVACGDVDGDGIDEIVTGPGPGASFGALVRGWDIDGSSASLPGINFFAWPPAEYGYGVRIAVDTDMDGDGRSEIVAGPGPDPSAGTPLRVFSFDGSTISLRLSNEAYPPGWTHGTNVASGRF